SLCAPSVGEVADLLGASAGTRQERSGVRWPVGTGLHLGSWPRAVGQTRGAPFQRAFFRARWERAPQDWPAAPKPPGGQHAGTDTLSPCPPALFCDTSTEGQIS